MKGFVSKLYVRLYTQGRFVLIFFQFIVMKEAVMKIREAGARVVVGVTLITMDETQAGDGEDIDDLMSKMLIVQTTVW